MTIGLTGVKTSAKEPELQLLENNNYSASEVKIDETTVDWYVTNRLTNQIDRLRIIKENDNSYTSYGWYDIENEGVNNRAVEESDFCTTIIDEKIIYTEKNSVPKVMADLRIGSIPDTNSELHSPRITYPTSWNSTTSYGSVATNVSTVIGVASILVGLASVAIGVVMGVAGIIVGMGLKNVYYKNVRWYRLMDSLTQEYYHVYTWYSNANYTGIIDTTKTGVQTIYLG